jgi:hypothetical protein
MKTMTETAARIIAQAREAWTNNAETEGGADAFDHHISLVGVEPFGALYNEAYALANEGHEVVAGGGETQLAERKERAAQLWAQVLPELEEYAAGCRSASFTGWSGQSDGPIRRVRPVAVGTRVTVPEDSVPEDWARDGEVVETDGQTAVIELSDGHRQELPVDELTATA